MSWDAIGAIGEIAGALAVVASLFYVGLQVRQNATAIKGQTYESIAAKLAEFSMHMADDPQLSDLLQRGIANESLTSEEEVRFVSVVRANMRAAASAHYQYSLGLMDDRQLLDLTYSSRALLATSIGARVWQTSNASLDPAFVAYIDELLNPKELEQVARMYGTSDRDNA